MAAVSGCTYIGAETAVCVAHEVTDTGGKQSSNREFCRCCNEAWHCSKAAYRRRSSAMFAAELELSSSAYLGDPREGHKGLLTPCEASLEQD